MSQPSPLNNNNNIKKVVIIKKKTNEENNNEINENEMKEIKKVTKVIKKIKNEELEILENNKNGDFKLEEEKIENNNEEYNKIQSGYIKEEEKLKEGEEKIKGEEKLKEEMIKNKEEIVINEEKKYNLPLKRIQVNNSDEKKKISIKKIQKFWRRRKILKLTKSKYLYI
jgi:hypothetical protein